MKIIKKYDQIQRSFKFDGECEQCKQVEREIPGVDTEKWENEILPKMPCKKCGSTTLSIRSGTEGINNVKK